MGNFIVAYGMLSSMRHFFYLSLVLVSSLWSEEPVQVLVTMVPYQFVVEEIGGKEVEVSVLVPPGVSGHTFEPSAKEMIKASQAAIWFRIGETFEDKILPVLKNHNPNLIVVDLREGMPLLYDQGGCPHCKGSHSEDLHYWLSPKIVRKQAELIAVQLKKLRPEGKLHDREFLQTLDQTAHQVAEITSHAKIRTILAAHAAYAYFCHDFGFRQLSIEVEGKEPSPRQIVALVDQAKALGIKKVFIQPQYSAKGANLIAKQIGAEVVNIDPYAKNVFACWLEIAKEFSN